MSMISTPNAAFRHIVLEGTSYECGFALGEHIKTFSAAERAMYTELKPEQSDMAPEALRALMELNDRHCPGVGDEIRGMADGLGVPLPRLAANLMWHSPMGCCSHIAVLAGETEENHTLVARSYEWSTDDALCLITTRVKGKYAHIGFSIMGCGRFDGINEKGLCITMSAGAPGKEPTGGGFLFWAAIRAALDCCATVEEAVAHISAMPSCFYDNLILTDRHGNAALIEDACGHRAVKRIGPDSEQKHLFSTNHYTLPGMAERGSKPMWMSVARYQRIEREFAQRPKASKESLRALLTAPVPEGLSCHYYSDWFGTLWSMLFDVTEGTVEVCFGSPRANGWHTFGLQDPAGVKTYPVVLPDESCTDRRFFSTQWE